jgi:hypothetical protein
VTGRGTARSSKGRTARPKRPPVHVRQLTEEKAADATKRYQELLDETEDYLERELERILKEEGNSAEAIRLSKHFAERLKEARQEAVGPSDPTPATRQVGFLERGVGAAVEEPVPG